MSNWICVKFVFFVWVLVWVFWIVICVLSLVCWFFIFSCVWRFVSFCFVFCCWSVKFFVLVLSFLVCWRLLSVRVCCFFVVWFCFFWVNLWKELLVLIFGVLFCVKLGVNVVEEMVIIELVFKDLIVIINRVISLSLLISMECSFFMVSEIGFDLMVREEGLKLNW